MFFDFTRANPIHCHTEIQSNPAAWRVAVVSPVLSEAYRVLCHQYAEVVPVESPAMIHVSSVNQACSWWSGP